MDVLVTCKNEEDPIKTEGAGVVTTFLPLYVYGNIFKLLHRNSTVARRVTNVTSEHYGDP